MQACLRQSADRGKRWSRKCQSPSCFSCLVSLYKVWDYLSSIWHIFVVVGLCVDVLLTVRQSLFCLKTLRYCRRHDLSVIVVICEFILPMKLLIPGGLQSSPLIGIT